MRAAAPASVGAGWARGLAQTDPDVYYRELRGVYANHQQGASAAERARSPLPADPDRVLHLVRPGDTDPAIDQFLQDHYALVSRAVPQNGALFVFFPGTYARPREYQWLLDEAAGRGYHVVGLEYPDMTDNPRQSAVAQLCGRDPDPDCAGRVRQARLSGGEVPGKLSVTPANAISNRLVRVLEYLARQYPGEGWDGFAEGDTIDWTRMAVGGHSQGAGVAAFIAQQQPVARVALWSGPADYVRAADAYAAWMRTPSATPPDRYYGLAHAQEQGAARILGGLATLGLDQFGPPVTLSGDQAPPAGARTLVLTLPHQPTALPSPDPYHDSTATDRMTPLATDGRPAYRAAWDALLGP
jgi:hypothetical protein